MRFMKILLLAMTLGLAVAAASEQKSVPAYADYYFKPMEPAYASVLTAIQLLEKCLIKGNTVCPQNLNEVDILRLASVERQLTVGRPLPGENQSIQTASEFDSRWAEARTAILRDSYKFELEFLSRYAATGLECPRKAGADRDLRVKISALRQVALLGFWQLNAQQAKTVVEEAETRTQQLSKDLAARRYSYSNCEAMRKFGAGIESLMHEKLNPYVKGGEIMSPDTISTNQRFGQEAEFILGVARLVQDEGDNPVFRK